MNQTASNPIVACLEKEMPEELWGIGGPSPDEWAVIDPDHDDEKFFVAVFRSDAEAAVALTDRHEWNHLVPYRITLPEIKALLDVTWGYVLLEPNLIEINRQYLR